MVVAWVIILIVIILLILAFVFCGGCGRNWCGSNRRRQCGSNRRPACGRRSPGRSCGKCRTQFSCSAPIFWGSGPFTFNSSQFSSSNVTGTNQVVFALPIVVGASSLYGLISDGSLHGGDKVVEAAGTVDQLVLEALKASHLTTDPSTGLPIETDVPWDIGNNFVVTLLKNGAPTTVQATIQNKVTGAASDTKDSISVVAGDVLALQILPVNGLIWPTTVTEGYVFLLNATVRFASCQCIPLTRVCTVPATATATVCC